MVKCYYSSSQRIAMRTGTGSGTSGLIFLLGDHLGSTSVSYQVDTAQKKTQLYYPWGSLRYPTTYNMPTKYGYTGQYSNTSDFGLLYFNARWYEPGLGRFAQADSIVPDISNPADFDRYAYVRNSPVMHRDPSGHDPCSTIPDPAGQAACSESIIISNSTSPYQLAQLKIKRAGYQPDPGCAFDPICSDSYDTFVNVVVILGYVPSMKQILRMTAGTEYTDYRNNSGVREFGQSALAHNYYSACGIDGCSGNELYVFFSGYQPWYGKPYVMGDGSASDRAAHLVNDGLESTSSLDDDFEQILNLDTAKKMKWDQGKVADKPWQWWGPFKLKEGATPTFCREATCVASLSVTLTDKNGNITGVFWMFTAEQNDNFNIEDWEEKEVNK